MLKMNAHAILRLVAGAAVVVAFAVSPQLALAQNPGALTALSGGPATGTGLNGTQDVVVSPNGDYVYAIGNDDDAIAEFARGTDGSLTQIGCIADSSDSDNTSCSDNATATGLVDPEAIVISPNGDYVYVAAEDTHDIGDIAEFAVNSDGSLTQLGSGNACIAENTDETDDVASDCTGDDVGNQTGHGMEFPDALAVSPDGDNVYVGDSDGEAVAELTVGAGGALSQPDGADDCIRDSSLSSDGADCNADASGIASVTGIAVSPDGDNVYTSGEFDGDGAIAEFTRSSETGLLTSVSCLGTDADEDCDGVTGVVGITGIIVSPDGNNVYTASEEQGGPIAEFSRGGEDGELSQLTGQNNCIEEATDPDDNDYGCNSTAYGIEDGYSLAISPDGTDVYAAASTNDCLLDDACDDVAEFTRDPSSGALAELPSPDSCIQDSSQEGSECPNENGSGLGGPGLAISPDGNNVYVTGDDDIAEFGRGTQTLTVSLAGTGTGAVSDGTGAIACPGTCSNAYSTDSAVTLTATPASGSTFTGWSGACSGTGTCQVTMNAAQAVTATFTSTAAPTPGAPTPVLTSAPTAITDGGAGFLGSVNPEGLPTTVYFQYGPDKRYSQAGASGANYTAQTPGQQIAGDFADHTIGPVSVAGLLPNALYHVRLVATNSDGTAFGQDVTFTTALAPLPGPPTLGQTFNLKPVSGLVFVLIHGHLVPLTQLEQIGPGVTIDALHGTFQLTISVGGGGPARDATAARAKTQTGQFGGAVVRLHQATHGANRGLATVMMVESAFKGAPAQSICNAPKAASDAHAAKVSSKVIQLLHASAHGKFATSGRYSAATVRGTIWNTIARCDGTLIHAIKDEVVVTDFVRHKTIVLHAGQSYLAPGP
jgi:Divergent InlB B-repeat domain